MVIIGDRDRVDVDDSLVRVSRKEEAHWIVAVVRGGPGRCSLEHL